MKFFESFLRSVNGFLAFVENHQNGILATVVVHLFIITSFLVIKINTSTYVEQGILIDMTAYNEVRAETVQQDEQQQNNDVNTPPDGERLRNLAVNTDPSMNRNLSSSNVEMTARENINRMVDDIKRDLEIDDTNTAKDYDPYGTVEPETVSANSKTTQETSAPSGSGLRKGDTTVSYELANRSHEYIHYPVYKCKGSAVVVLEIIVNRNGYIISALPVKTESNYQDDCFLDAAQKSARVTRFNADTKAPEKQKGTITYNFVAQDLL